MVLISGFPELTDLQDKDVLLVERPGASPQYFHVKVATLKKLLAVQPTVTLVEPAARYKAGERFTSAANSPSRWASEIGSNDLVSSGSGIALVQNVLNGKPVVSFGGSGFLSSSSIANVSCGFIVCNHTDGASFTDFRRILDFGDNPGSLFGISGTSDYSPKSFARNISAGGLKVNGQISLSALPLAAYKILFFRFDAPVSLRFWIGTYSGSGAQLFRGNIADIVLFDRYLSTTQEADWQSALAKEWGI
jgi:hypothetical protein